MSSPDTSLIEDARRLEALERYDILDTAPEPSFDDIVAVARALCEVPVALISLLDRDRQFFKARTGFDGSGTPIAMSICTHALAKRATLVIPDLRQDTRTADNPLVVGDPNIRFYAGAPLVTGDGHVLGTLCVIDLVPRPGGLTNTQVAGLEALARHTMMMMELRRVLSHQGEALSQVRRTSMAVLDRVRASEEAGERLRQDTARAFLAQEAGRIGTFDVDLATDLVRTSPEMCRIYGLPEQPTYPALTFEPLTIGEDRNLRSSQQSRRDGTAALAAEYRIRRVSDGAVRWVSRRGEFIRDETGAPLQFVGTIHDVTEHRLAQLRQSALLELADATRDASSTAEVVGVAAGILGRTLDASRVGYSEIDQAGGVFRVERDWTPAGAESVAGRHRLNLASPSLVRLAAGEIVAADRVGDVDWLFADVPAAVVGTQAQIKVPLTRRGGLVGVLFVHSATTRHWSQNELDFAASLADRTYAAVARVRAEEDQRLLNEELSHRLKNNLAMVQAIAKQTLRGVQDRPAVHGLNQRLVALGTAHDVLFRQNWLAARIAPVVDSALALHAESARFDVSGPDMSLNARTVLSLSMLLHELATNALKYGALSADTGRVTLAWTVDAEPDAAVFTMTWEEIGGPPVNTPSRQGFGSRLIRMGLAGTGDTRLRYDPTGFRGEFRAPLNLVSEI